jgi:hypothetical protein
MAPILVKGSYQLDFFEFSWENPEISKEKGEKFV